MLGTQLRSSGAPPQPQRESPALDPLQSLEGTTHMPLALQPEPMG
jgi:hypothetical protein